MIKPPLSQQDQQAQGGNRSPQLQVRPLQIDELRDLLMHLGEPGLELEGAPKTAAANGGRHSRGG